jgi:single-strand DNA-binding protein
MLIGNVVRTPELRHTPGGHVVCDLSVAVNRTYTAEDGEKKEESTFVDCVVWARLAETAVKYLTKGRLIYLEGRLQTDSWVDKATGQKRSRLRVVVENLQMLDSRSGSAVKESAPEMDISIPY